MMAPKYERLALIGEVAHALDDPIDRLEVRRDRIVAWAGGRRVSFTYGLGSTCSDDGQPLPGGHSWFVVEERAGAGHQPGRFRSLLARLGLIR